MTAEDITIPCGKYDWLWAWHDRGDAGQESTNLAIMIHGFPGDHLSYGDVFGNVSDVFLTKGYHTLRFDMRGCGQSDKGAKFFSFQTAAEDCVTVLQWAEKLGYKKFCFVAEGLGAPVALTVLGDRIRPKVTGALFLWPIIAPRDSVLSKLIRDKPETFNPVFIKEVQDYNFTPLMPRLTMPTTVLCGSIDTKAPSEKQADVLRATITGNNLEIITFEGGEHGLKSPNERQFLLKQAASFMRKII